MTRYELIDKDGRITTVQVDRETIAYLVREGVAQSDAEDEVLGVAVRHAIEAGSIGPDCWVRTIIGE